MLRHGNGMDIKATLGLPFYKQSGDVCFSQRQRPEKGQGFIRIGEYAGWHHQGMEGGGLIGWFYQNLH